MHSPHSTAAFDINIDNISTAKIFIPKLTELNKENNFVIVSPDAGGLQKARFYANILNTDLAFADKRRYAKNKSEIVNFEKEIPKVPLYNETVLTWGSDNTSYLSSLGYKCIEISPDNQLEKYNPFERFILKVQGWKYACEKFGNILYTACCA
jgi:hypothetical protein